MKYGTIPQRRTKKGGGQIMLPVVSKVNRRPYEKTIPPCSYKEKHVGLLCFIVVCCGRREKKERGGKKMAGEINNESNIWKIMSSSN